MSIQQTTPKIAVNLKRTFPAPREKVFDAWTRPEALKKWWGPEGFSSQKTTVDLRVGGEYRHEMKGPDGEISYQFGTYLEIRRPEKLVFTFSCTKFTEAADGSVATVEFLDRGGSTEVVLSHEGINEVPGMGLEESTAAWTSSLDKLDRAI